jgi:FkbM family methyltransferase
MADRSGSEGISRLLRPLRSVRRSIVRALPADRRIKGLGGAKGRGRLQVRKLVAPLFQRPVVLTAADGVRLRVSADPVDEHIAEYVLGARREEYFPPWPPDAPPVECILDVGAHHGLYAAVALHEYPSSRIVCVEPSARALVELGRNLELNGTTGRARIVAAALAADAGHGELRHTAEGSWGASLYEDEALTTASEHVALAPLSDILAGDRPQIVKCNAEGAEYSLLEQLRDSDIRPTLMIVMVHPDFGDMERLLAHAEAMHYAVTRIGTTERPAFHLWHHDRAGSVAG